MVLVFHSNDKLISGFMSVFNINPFVIINAFLRYSSAIFIIPTIVGTVQNEPCLAVKSILYYSKN